MKPRKNLWISKLYILELLAPEQEMKGEVEDRAKYGCSLCDFDTEVEEEIKLHMDSHEICMVFSCKHCSYQVKKLLEMSLIFDLIWFDLVCIGLIRFDFFGLIWSELETLEWITFNPNYLIRISTVETFNFSP